MTRNHFTVLGLKPGANDDDVKKAYRAMAKKYHPDKNKEAGAEEKFKEVAAAYEVLKSKDRREIYEREINRPKGGFVRTEFRAPGGMSYENNYRAKEEFFERRRSEPPPRFNFDEDPFTGPYSQYRNSKGFKEKEFHDQAGQKPKGAYGKRHQRKPKWNNNWNDMGDDMNFHDNGDKSSFSFAFKSFMDDMDFTMSFTLDGENGFTSFFGDADPFGNIFGKGPGPQQHFAANRRHRRNVAGEHGYSGGLNEDYLFSPRSGMDSSDSESDSSDSDFDYSGMRFTCAFCGKKLKLEDLKTHEPACGQRRKKNININIDSDEEKEERGYKKMFQEKTGDWRRDHEKFQEYVKRAKRAYRINKSRDATRMESKLLCRLCGKVIERGEAQTHSLFCHQKDHHFGPQNGNEEPSMKDSKFKRAKEYAKKKVPKFKKSFSADDQPNQSDSKAKGRETADEPMSSSGTGLNPTSPTSRFGKTKRAPPPPAPKPGPGPSVGPTVGPAPMRTSPRSEESTKEKVNRRSSYPQGPQSNQSPSGQRSSYTPGQQNNLRPHEESPNRPPSNTQLLSQGHGLLSDNDPTVSTSTPRTSKSDTQRRTSKVNNLKSPRSKSRRNSSRSERRNEHLPDIDDNYMGFSSYNCTPRVFLKETTVKL